MYMGKHVTCQWHLRECAKKQLSSVNPPEKETFKSLYSHICYASTASECERIRYKLEQICERNNIMTLWNWWKARHFHIVPAFREFCVSGLNMAASGQSVMKTRGKMWLSVAVTGKGLNLVQQKEREKAERNLINSACEALESGDIEAEVLIEMDPSH